MAKFQAWVCDRCQSVHQTDDELWTCAVVYTNKDRHFYTTNHRDLQHSKSQLMCRSCMAAIGIFKPAKNDPKPDPVVQPSFEDMLREFVWEIAQEVVSASR